jgi:hypothetical protein
VTDFELWTLAGLLAAAALGALAVAVVWVLGSTRDGLRRHIASLPTTPPYSPPDRIPDGDTVRLPTVAVAATRTVSVDRQPTVPLRPPHRPRHAVNLTPHKREHRRYR